MKIINTLIITTIIILIIIKVMSIMNKVENTTRIKVCPLKEATPRMPIIIINAILYKNLGIYPITAVGWLHPW